MSNKTTIKEKLKDKYAIYFTRKELYKALCAYNDSMHRIYTIDELERLLAAKDDMLEEFSEYLLNTFEPEHKFVA